MIRRMVKYMALLLALPAQSFATLDGFDVDLIAAARERTSHAVTYDGSYMAIAYPMGDVPSHIGVCTDLIVRSYRSVGIDLQQLVHEDMTENFNSYPKRWGLRRPDHNIDHRRVPNLQTFFERYGKTLKISSKGSDYRAGDLVTWMLPGNLPHIGLVSDVTVSDHGDPLIIHNIGRGPAEEDILFSYPITGHYRFKK